VNLPEEQPETGVAREVVHADTFRLSIGNALGEIGKVIDLLELELGARQVASGLVHTAQTVADELVTNVIRHGFLDDRPHTIEVIVGVNADGLTLQVSDDGIPFDPCGGPAPDPTRPILERRAGGLGIPLVRQLAFECSYARVGGQNQVTVVLRHPVP
jgi:anti-sigma regulatory factor (Ser/Thr protein kinase)